MATGLVDCGLGFVVSGVCGFGFDGFLRFDDFLGLLHYRFMVCGLDLKVYFGLGFCCFADLEWLLGLVVEF